MSGSLSLWRRLLERCSHRRRIPDVLWLQTLRALPFLRPWPVDDLLRLRHLAEQFLGKKEFSAAGGLTISDAMAVSIAAQACLPVLKLGLAPYDAFVGIVVHPDEVVARRSVMDDDGIVPVNPVYAGRAILGEHVYPSLHTIPHELDVDMVDIFRHAEAVPGVVADALACLPKLRTIWMQLGISHPQAANHARAQGLTVIEDRCPKIEFPRWR